MMEIMTFGKAYPAKKQAQYGDRDDLVYRFDSGAGLTIKDLQAHLLATGITGSGKTTSVALPLLRGVLATGCGAFIADHKGNLRSLTRKICKLVGREDDVVEYGTGPLATPINIIEGVPIHYIRNFFSTLMRNGFEGKSGNLDFHESGVQLCVDCVSLLRILNKELSDFPVPNISLVCELLMNESRAIELFSYFKKNIYNHDDEEQFELVQKVESSPFHILSKGRSSSSESTRAEQISYRLTQIKLALSRLLEVPALKRNFASGSVNVDFNDALEKRKIILFRLDPGIGPIGEDICRIFIENWYHAIFERTTERAVPTFTLLDEFQSICDLSNRTYSDKRFIAESREFKAAVAILTQNISNLMNTETVVGSVDSLIHNLNTKIMFYNSDPKTAATLDAYINADLTSLARGEAYIVRFDSETGEHIACKDACNEAYNETEEALKSVSEDEISVKNEDAPEPQSLLSIIVKLRNSDCLRKTDHNNEMHRVQYRPSGDDDMRFVSELIKSEGWSKGDNDTNEFVYRFPHLFAENAVISCPAGWKQHLINVLTAFDATNLKIKIKQIDASRSIALTAACEEESSSQLAGIIFKNLLTKIFDFCVICGELLANNRNDYVCEACLRKYGVGMQSSTSTSKQQVNIHTPIDELF